MHFLLDITDYWSNSGDLSTYFDGIAFQHYDNIKDEIRNSEFIDTLEWMQIINKAQIYYQTNKVRV